MANRLTQSKHTDRPGAVCSLGQITNGSKIILLYLLKFTDQELDNSSYHSHPAQDNGLDNRPKTSKNQRICARNKPWRELDERQFQPRTVFW
jgi:hypothetical protein